MLLGMRFQTALSSYFWDEVGLVWLYGRGVGDAVYESLVHALIDLVVTRDLMWRLGMRERRWSRGMWGDSCYLFLRTWI